VIVAWVIGYVLGSGWYIALAKPWRAAAGLTREIIASRRKETMRAYVISAAGAFLGILALAILVQLTKTSDAGGGLALGLLVGVGFIAVSNAIHYSFEYRPLKLYLINTGYPVLQLALAGLVLGLWQ
jgi:hypothetical protein